MGNTENEEYFKLWWYLVETAFFASKARNKELSKYDITMEQAGILICIKELGDDVTSAELGRTRGRERATMSEALTTMARKGLVEKSKDPINANQLRIKLTEKARKIIEEYDKRDTIRSTFSIFSKEELALMEKLFKKIHKQVLAINDFNDIKKPPMKFLVDIDQTEPVN